MRKKIKMISVILLGCVVITYAGMLLSVAPILSDAKNVFMNIPTKKNVYCLQRYDTSRYGANVQRKVSILPLLVLHNYQKGYVYVRYSSEVLDKQGALLNGASGIMSKWEIEKIGDTWAVINITESP